MSLHDDALATLRAWRPADELQERRRRAYVAHLEAHPDGLERSCHPAHVTAGALIVARRGDGRTDRPADRVLLTLHAKARRWFHMGGHCEARDTTLAGAALREAVEESGVPDLVVDPEPVQLHAHEVRFCGDHEQVTHLDVRFVAVAPPGAVPAVSEESLDVRWWPVDALPTDDPDMVELVRLAVARAGQVSSAAISAAPSGEQSGDSATIPS